MTTRVLYLLRHAAAENTAESRRDIDRPLREEGIAQAEAVGAILRDQQTGVELIVCSPSQRTRETASQLGTGAPLEVVDDLYNSGAAFVRDAIVGVDPAVTCLLVVGHAPGIPAAVHEFTDREVSDADALDVIDTHFPTATLARLEFDGDWADLADDREEFARLTFARRG